MQSIHIIKYKWIASKHFNTASLTCEHAVALATRVYFSLCLFTQLQYLGHDNESVVFAVLIYTSKALCNINYSSFHGYCRHFERGHSIAACNVCVHLTLHAFLPNVSSLWVKQHGLTHVSLLFK